MCGRRDTRNPSKPASITTGDPSPPVTQVPALPHDLPLPWKRKLALGPMKVAQCHVSHGTFQNLRNPLTDRANIRQWQDLGARALESQQDLADTPLQY